MTVSNQQTEFAYVGNGVTVTFAYSCQVQKAGDLQVYVNSAAVTGGITKNGIGSLSGGSVTFSVAPASGAAVRLERVVVLERTTDYQQNGDFLARVVNPDFDRIWMALQQIGAGFSRVMRFPKSDINPVTELPPAAARANKLLAFDNLGNPSTALPVIGSATDLQMALFGPDGVTMVGNAVDARILASTAGPGLIGFDATKTTRDLLDLLYFGFVNIADKRFAGGAKCDGVTDDTAAIQAAHDYIVSTGRQGTLLMPSGVVCKCNSGLVLNVSFVRFNGQSSQLDFSGMGPGIAITVTGNGTGTPYSQAVSGLSHVDILGPGGGSLVTDALHFTTITEAGTAQIMVEAVVVHGFHVGHTLINNAYCINFYGCAIYNCGTCTTQPAGATNAGERITYSGCTLFNSGEGVDMQNSTGEYHFINCSFDYNAGHFYVNGGALVLTDCHVEGNSYLQPPIRVGGANGSSFSWKGGELLCTGSNTVPMVLCQVAALKGGGAFIDGVFQHNLGSSVYFATGTGLVKNENVKTYDTSTLPTLVSDSLSLFVDGSFEDATLPDVFITQDTVAITSRLTGTDIILSSSATSPRTGAKSLKAAKTFGGGSAASFIAVAPLKIGENYTGVRGWYAKNGAQTGNMFITHLFIALRDDKATPAILRSASGGQRTVTFSSATVPYTEFLISFESGRAPSWATHVGISVNMAGLGAGDVFFDDFEAAEF